MLNHTLIHSSILDKLILYFLCCGSLFFSIRVYGKLKFHKKNEQYLTAFIINSAIFIYGLITLQIKLQFHYTSVTNTIFMALISISMAIFMFFVELKSYQTNPIYFRLLSRVSVTTISASLTAVSEEVLFRGIIVLISTNYQGSFRYLLLTFGTLMFGASHLYYGWKQFLLKNIFSVSLTLLVLMSDNLIFPIITHVIFNYMITQLFNSQEKKI
ncbi:MAG: CPBP family intramembrane metalloprotease [Legionellales bacterium]|nr:CPBP family intramembrane metalloprotease [Legionellales bacterium]